jgi:hypothetical protein
MSLMRRDGEVIARKTGRSTSADRVAAVGVDLELVVPASSCHWRQGASWHLIWPALRWMRPKVGGSTAQADSGTVTLIKCFGPAANLNIHPRCRLGECRYRLRAMAVPKARAGLPRWRHLRSVKRIVRTTGRCGYEG